MVRLDDHWWALETAGRIPAKQLADFTVRHPDCAKAAVHHVQIPEDVTVTVRGQDHHARYHGDARCVAECEYSEVHGIGHRCRLSRQERHERRWDEGILIGRFESDASVSGSDEEGGSSER